MFTNYKRDGPMLFLSRESYSIYMGHLNKKHFENEELEREKAHRKHLKEKSHEMASQWPDSIQNIKNRDKKRHEIRQKLQDEKRTEQFQHYQHFQEEERKRYLTEAKEKIKMKRYPNSILSNALLESHVRMENEAILKLKKEKEREEADDEARWIEKMRETDEMLKRRDKEEMCEVLRKSKMIQTFQLNQIEEKSRTAMNEKSDRLKEELHILEKMNEEINERKNNELEDMRRQKMEMKRNMRAHHLNKERTEQILKTKEAEEQMVCDIYNNFHTKKICTLENQRKQKMKDFSVTKQRLGLSNKQKEDEKKAKQNQIYSNQCLEMEKRFEEEKCRDTNLRKEMVKELNTYYRDYETKKQEENKEKAVIFRYELAERLKNAEVVKSYEERKNKKHRESEFSLTKEWAKQIEERNELVRNRESQNSTTDLYPIEDSKFFSYAKEVLEYARVRGMDTSPIIRDIINYCKNNQLPPYPKCLEMEEGGFSTSSNNIGMKLPRISKN